MIKSQSNGHEIYFNEDTNKWYFKDTGKIVNHERACSKCGKPPIVMDYNNKIFRVDACIAPIVKALNDGGIKTLASCCGHHNPLCKSIIMEYEGEELWCVLLSRQNFYKYITNHKLSIYGE